MVPFLATALLSATVSYGFLHSMSDYSNSPFVNLPVHANRNNIPTVLQMADGEESPSEPKAARTDAKKPQDESTPEAKAKPVSTGTKQSQYGVTTEAIESYVKCGKCKNFFYLAPEDLGDGRGKRLECCVCKHSWFQSTDRILNIKPGFELLSLTDNDLNRIKENVAAGKPHDFVGDGKLYVGNLSFDVTEEDLVTTFSEYGVVGDAFIVQGDDGRPRGFAFVTMRTYEDSKKVMEALDGEEVFGRRLQIREPNN